MDSHAANAEGGEELGTNSLIKQK